MGLYSGGLIIRRIFASEIWAAYFQEGLFLERLTLYYRNFMVLVCLTSLLQNLHGSLDGSYSPQRRKECLYGMGAYPLQGAPSILLNCKYLNGSPLTTYTPLRVKKGTFGSACHDLPDKTKTLNIVCQARAGMMDSFAKLLPNRSPVAWGTQGIALAA